MSSSLKFLSGLSYIMSGALQTDVKWILYKLDKGVRIMVAGLAEMDAALAQLDASQSSITQSLAELDTNTTKLAADIKALKSRVSPDLQPQVDKILANATAISNVSTTLSAAVAQVAAASADANS